MGQISIYSLPSFRRQVLYNCIKPTDITALSSLQFTPYAHAFYLQSSSELSEVAFSTQMNVPCSMMISYDKFQRNTIIRSNEDRTIKEKVENQETSPNTIEPEEPVSITIVNNSGLSANSDSAIDLDSNNITNNHPSK